MGTRMTLLYANFFMAALEKQMPTQVPPQSQTPHMATLHQRHIHAVDPRFHSPQQFPSTHQLIPPHNQIQPPAISHTSVNFPDTTVLLTEQCTLQSTLYTKLTDKGLATPPLFPLP